jgi:hypothetical protein
MRIEEISTHEGRRLPAQQGHLPATFLSPDLLPLTPSF